MKNGRILPTNVSRTYTLYASILPDCEAVMAGLLAAIGAMGEGRHEAARLGIAKSIDRLPRLHGDIAMDDVRDELRRTRRHVSGDDVDSRCTRICIDLAIRIIDGERGDRVRETMHTLCTWMGRLELAGRARLTAEAA